MVQYKFFGNYLKNHCAGKSKAIKSRELEQLFDCKGSEIRQMTNECRRNGIPVCSGSMGYYYPTKIEDIQQTITGLISRICGITAAKEGLISYLESIKCKE